MKELIDVLLVEDDPACARAMTGLLGVSGRITEVAETIAEAADKLTLEPLAVVVDLELSGERGEDLIRIVRERLPNCRVIVWTGEPEGPRLDEAKKIADELIVKAHTQFGDIVTKFPKQRNTDGGWFKTRIMRV